MKNYEKIFTDNPFIDELIYFTKTLAINAVIKDSDKADEKETVESLKAADIYIACRESRARFENFNYDLDFLIESQILPPAIIEACAKDNTRVPDKYKPDLTIARSKKYIEDYIETNDYYRNYMGLPNMQDTRKDFIYLNEDYLIGVPELENPERPVHLMNNQDLTILYSHGVVDQLIQDYPSKTYLSYMSDNAIDVYKARKAVAFQILYIPTVSNNELMDRWNNKYEQNRMYTMKTYYSDAYKLYSDYYNNFIIVFIILQTMIDIISEVQEFIARRDIFDDRSIRYLFESYGIPYYPEIPRVYQLAMVKNINVLLKWKASTKNMIDICSLFGFDEIDIFRYYLLRDRRVKLDGDNDPTNDEYQFHYKTIIDENGEEKVVPDNDKNYDLKFVRAPIEDKADNYLKDRTAYEDYDIITNQDQFWDGKSDHEDIKSAILDEEFSWVRTKYISIDTMYDLSEMTFDLPYFINMLLDDTTLEDYLYIKIPTIKNNHQFRVNDIFVYMLSLTHLYHGFEDKIMQTTTQVLSILGFNFHVDMHEVSEDIFNRYHYTLDDVGASNFDIPVSEITSFDRLLEIFKTNKEIWRIACKGMVDADNKRIYDCYKKIYDSCYIMDYTTTFFTLQDGSIAQTYTEFLKERDYVLYESIIDLRSYIDETALRRAISDIIIEVVYVLDEYMDSKEFKYVFSKFPAASGDYIRTFMLKIVNFFKSYKVHLLDISTVYKAFDKRENSIKIYEDWLMSVDKSIDDYSQIIEEIITDLNLSKTDKINLLEEVYFDIERWEFKDYDDKYEFDLKQQISELLNEMTYKDSVTVVDHYKDFPFAGIEYKYEKDDKLYLIEQLNPAIDVIHNDRINILDKMRLIIKSEEVVSTLVPGPTINGYLRAFGFSNVISVVFTKTEAPVDKRPTARVVSEYNNEYKIYMYLDGDIVYISPEYGGITIYANSDSRYMFSQCNSLTSLDVSNFNTSKVTNMYQMFYNCNKLTSLDVSNWDTSKVTTMYRIFFNCSSLTSLDLSNFNTSNVTIMNSMFWNCDKLTSLDLSRFDTSNVTDMGAMFTTCKSLTSIIGLENFNTSNVTYMASMFSSCNNLTSLDLSNFDTSNVTDMASMFSSCNNLTSLDLSNVNTSKVTNMNSMFYDCNKLISLDLSNWDTSSVTFMSGVFTYCRYLDSIKNIENLNTSNVTNMGGMFYSCSRLTSLDLSNWDTSNVTNMNNMFYACGSDSLNLSNWDTSNITDMANMFFFSYIKYLNLSNWTNYKVTSMHSMFNRCDSLITLNLSNFNTSNVTYMGSMFTDCHNLTSIIGLENFNTSNVTSMYRMFSGCNRLKVIDLSRWDTSKVINTSEMFNKCNGLVSSITIMNKDFDTSNDTKYSGMFNSCSTIPSSKFTVNYTDSITKEIARKMVATKSTNSNVILYEPPTVTLLPGLEFNKILRSVMYNTSPKIIFTNTTKPNDITGNIVSTVDSESKAYLYRLNDNIYISPEHEGSVMYANPDSSNMISLDVNLTEVIDVSNLNTSKVTNMSSMFSNCSKLITLDLSSFDTSMVNNMSKMFSTCIAIQSITGLEKFNTSNVTDMNSMFYNCSTLTSLNLSNFDTSNVVNMYRMFSGCNKVISLDLSSFNTTNVTNMRDMLRSCNKLTSLDISSFDTSRVTDIHSMFYSCREITSLEIAHFNTSNVATMGWMFFDCNKLATLTLTGWDTNNVTDMSGMFNYCNSLTSLDVSSFNTSSVTDTREMFNYCNNLGSLNLSNFDMSKVTNMSSMFWNCNKLTSNITISNPNITSYSSMFGSCSTIPPAKFVVNYTDAITKEVARKMVATKAETSNVVLYEPPAITFLPGPDFSTKLKPIASTATSVVFTKTAIPADKIPSATLVSTTDSLGKAYMYLDDTTIYISPEIETAVMYANTDSSTIFKGCYNLTSLDLSNFNTSNVTNMDSMFYMCWSLTSLDVSSFDTSNVTNMNYMFGSLSALTSLDLSNLNTSSVVTMSNMFKSIKVTPLGLSNFDTSKVTDMNSMFSSCDKLISLDLSNFNTSNVTNMKDMFTNCYNLVLLDVSSFDTSSVTNMNSMFYECNSLTSLDVSNFSTSNVTDMRDMFSNCSSLTSLNVYNFDTSSVIFMNNMFFNCNSLTSLDVSNFNISKVTNMGNMFLNCSSLTSLDVSNFNTSKIQNMNGMFKGCSSLTSIIGLENLNTSKTYDMKYMFQDCSVLTSSITIMTSRAGYTDIFNNCSTADGSEFIVKYTDDITKEIARQMVATKSINSNVILYEPITESTLVYGLEFSGMMTGIYSNIINIKFTKTAIPADKISDPNTTLISTADSLSKAYLYQVDDTVYVSPEKDNCILYANEDSSQMFRGDWLNGLQSIDFTNLNTSRVTNMSKMFEWNYIPVLDVSSFDTSNVTNMNYMFGGCESITSLDVSNFNTSKVTDMSYMFYYCGSLPELNLSNFDTSKVTDMNNMFGGPNNALNSLDLSNFDTSSVIDMSYMFGGFYNMTSLDVSTFNTSNVTNMKGMFYGMYSMVSINISGFDTSKVTDMNYMFNYCENLTSIIGLENLNTISVTNMGGMLGGCSLASIDVSKWNTSNVTNMSSLFGGCKSLTSLDLSNFDTSNVTNMSGMFSGMNLTTLDLSNFNTMKVTDMSNMFIASLNLESLDLSNFDTASVTTMKDMFYRCNNLKSLNISSFDTSLVANTEGMFYECFNLSSTINIMNSSITKYPEMFKLCSTVPPAKFVVNYISDATKAVATKMINTKSTNSNVVLYEPPIAIDLITGPNINTLIKNISTTATSVVFTKTVIPAVKISSATLVSTTNSKGKAYIYLDGDSIYISPEVENSIMYANIDCKSVFESCMLLTSIDVTNLNTSKSTNMANMFKNCSGLISIIGLENLNTSNSVNLSGMFNGCSSLLSLDVSGFDMTNVFLGYDMFTNCKSLISLNVDNLKFPKLTNMSSMFQNCSSLTSIDLSTWDTSGVSNMYQVFNGCSSLTSLDLSKWNTSNVTSMPRMFKGCSSLTTLNLNNFDTANIKDTNGTFQDCTNLTTLNISKWNISNVTNMGNMFNGCRNLTSTITIMNTGVTVYSAMFNNCATIFPAEFIVRHIDTDTKELARQMVATKSSASNVILYESPYVTLLPGTDFNNVLESMWSNASSVIFTNTAIPTEKIPSATLVSTVDSDGKAYMYLDGTNIYIAPEVRNSVIYANTDSSNMFNGYTNIITMDLVNINTSKVMDMNSMFYGCNNLISLDLSNFDTSMVNNMNYMFSGCNSLKSLDLSSFDTSKVINMSHIFESCKLLTSLNISSFNTINVTNMSHMFSDCSMLELVDVVNFNTSKVTSMSNMFNNCNALHTLDLSKWDTSMVTNMSFMFHECSSLLSLNTNTWDTSKVTDMSSMFRECNNLTSNIIIMGSDSTLYSNMFENCSTVSPAEFLVSYSNSTTKLLAKNMVDTKSVNSNVILYEVPEVTLITGSAINNMISTVGYNATNVVFTNTAIPADKIPSATLASTTDSLGKAYMYLDNTIIYISPEINGSIIYGNSDCSKMFDWNSRLIRIDLSALDTSRVVDMSSMFKRCSNLVSIVGLENFNTSNVTDMFSVFYKCSSLTSLDVSSFDTTNVTNMDTMFEGCTNLTSLDLSNFNTSKVVDMNNIFCYCSSLTSLDVSSFDTTNVTDISYMFYGCSNLASIIGLENFNTSKVTDMSYIFYKCSGLTSIIGLENFDTSNVTSMRGMFSFCSSLTSLNITNFNTSNVTTMYYMFAGCSGLTSLDVSSFDTTNVLYMESMFPGCGKLTSLDVSNFNTFKVTNMSGMFSSCNGLTTLDLSNFNTSKVVNMENMFGYCSKLTSLNITNFNTSSVTDIGYMFDECSSLTSLDLSNFDTLNVTSMHGMFKECSNLTSLDLSNFDTTNVYIMNSMFFNCTSLTTLDILHFNTSKVTNANMMFYGCNCLTSSITISNPSITNYLDMFYMCSINSPAKFIVNYTDDITKEIARKMVDTKSVTSNVILYEVPLDHLRLIDGPTFNTKLKSVVRYPTSVVFTKTAIPTDKISSATLVSTTDSLGKAYMYLDNTTVYVSPEIEDSIIYANSDCYNMFKYLVDLRSLDLSMLNTSKVTNMKSMFYDCERLTSLNLSNFDTSNVTSMNSMFSRCPSLISLDLSSFNTSNVTSMYYMFHDCKLLTLLDLSNFDTSNVTNMSTMFFNCKRLTSLNLSKWNTSRVADMSMMFRYCESLTSLDLSSFNTSNVTNMSMMFDSCYDLTLLNVSSFNTSNVTNMGTMFQECSLLTSLDISHFNTSKVINMGSMFKKCRASLDLSNFDTSKVTSMSYMFAGYSSPSLDISNFNTSNVTKMSNMFEGYSSPSLDLSKWNTSNVTNMSNMFLNCSSLTSLDVSNFNTSKVTNMEAMFYKCSNLTSLDVSKWNTSKVTDMGNMFSGCSSLTSSITIMNSNNTNYYSTMFYNCSTISPAKFVVNYIDDATKAKAELMIATKSATSNVVLGKLVII